MYYICHTLHLQSHIDRKLENGEIKMQQQTTGDSLAVIEPTALAINLPADIEREVRDLIRVTKLSTDQALAVFESFRSGFQPFLEVRNEALAVVVTDASQTELIKLARNYDEILMKADQELTAIHKVKKEEPLRISQMIDGSRRIPSNAIGKVRAHLKQQFDFVKIQQEKAIAEVVTARRARLAEYNAEHTVIIGLGTMDDEQFELILAGAKAKHEEETVMREAARGAAKRLERVNQISRLGFAYDGLNYVYDGDVVLSAGFLDSAGDAAFDQSLSEYGQIISARKAVKAEEERIAAEQYVIDKENARIAQEQLDELNRQKAEKARAEAALRLAPDKDKLVAYFKGVHDAAQPIPELESVEAKALAQRFFDSLAELVNRHATEADKLGGFEPCPF